MTELTLTAGVARANITPPLGTRFLGYILRVEPAIGVDSDLFVTALVLANETTKVVIVDCDLCAFTIPRADELRGKIAAAAQTPVSHVMFAYTHTHNGPPVERGRWATSQTVEDAYIATLDHFIVGAVREADANRRPARVGAGAGVADVAIHRREERADGTVLLGQNPAGPTDHQVGVVRIDGLDGRPIAALVNYAAHPVVLGPEPLLISADYPGVVREIVEAATGATCLFLMGAAGDQMPIEAWRDDPTVVRKIGGILGHEAVKVYLGIETRRTQVKQRLVISMAEVLVYDIEEAPGPTHTRLGAAERRVTLPLLPHPSLAETERHYQATLQLVADRQAQGDERMIYIAELEQRWATRLLEAVRAGVTHTSIQGVVQAIYVDGIAFLTAPGEAFVEIGLDAKRRSPVPHLFFASYANGGVGYIPTPDAYPKPGQRVVTPDGIAHKLVLTTPLAPECAGLVVDTGLELLDGILGQRGWRS